MHNFSNSIVGPGPGAMLIYKFDCISLPYSMQSPDKSLSSRPVERITKVLPLAGPFLRCAFRPFQSNKYDMIPT